ncbi:MAG: hypothetical protein EA401_03570 [Planctomycetota bacterium]|nr:MAG: hypothetical protein EA401_03570 [Planctomycetota bacterium]
MGGKAACGLWGSQEEARDCLAIAKEAALAAGAAIAACSRDAGCKGDSGHDLVTAADLASEQTLIQHLSRAFPGHRIEGEEGGCHGPSDSPRVWYLDPLDGTANFSRGIPYWAISVGMAWRGKPVVGVIHAPEWGVTLTALRGQGVWLNGEALTAPRPASNDPRSWIIAVDWPWDLGQRHRVNALTSAMSDHIRQYKTYGSAALDCVGLARGWLDAYIISDVYPWDLCAGTAALAELGLRLRTWSGQAWRLGRGEILACHPHMEAQLLQWCQDRPELTTP